MKKTTILYGMDNGRYTAMYFFTKEGTSVYRKNDFVITMKALEVSQISCRKK
jgi:hypothetical protein